MIIYFIVTFLLIELLAIYVILDKDFLSPAFLFTLSFFFSAVDVLSMKKVWEYTLHINTLIVVCGAPLFFLLAAVVVRGKKSYRGRVIYTGLIQKKTIVNHESNYINDGWLLFWGIFNVAIILIYGFLVVKSVIATGRSGSIPYLIFKYGEIQKNLVEGETTIAKIPRVLYHICTFNGYIWGYILAHDFSKNRIVNKRVFFCFLSSSLACLLEGTRGNAIYLLIATVVIFFMCEREKVGSKGLNPRLFFLALGIVIFFALLFNLYIIVAGVDTGIDSVWEYLSVYLGAPIINLDFFLESKFENSAIWGNNTFFRIYSWVAPKIGVPYKYQSGLSFNYLDGRGLGNVYTMYQGIIQDFDYVGAFVYVFIIGLISEILYLRVRKDINELNIINLSYMYIVPLIMLSFFYNKFSEGVLTISFLYYLIIWMATKSVAKIRVRFRR